MIKKGMHVLAVTSPHHYKRDVAVSNYPYPDNHTCCTGVVHEVSQYFITVQLASGTLFPFTHRELEVIQCPHL